MTKKQLLIWILQVILFTCLGSIQFFDNEIVQQSTGLWQTVFLVLHNHRLHLSLFCGFILAAISGWKDLYKPYTLSRSFRQTIMETIVGEIFNGDKRPIRITIFMDAGWLHILLIYFWKSLYQPQKWRKNGGRPRFGKYVLVNQRVGTENRSSRTFFYYSTKTE